MMRVLLVDDDPAIHMIVSAVLKPEDDYLLVHAQSGAEALQAVAASLPDLILLDQMMPDLDGPAVLERLRDAPDAALAKVPVIFLTAKSDPEDVQKLLDLGAAGVIAKPFDPTKLRAQIESLIPDRSP